MQIFVGFICLFVCLRIFVVVWLGGFVYLFGWCFGGFGGRLFVSVGTVYILKCSLYVQKTWSAVDKPDLDYNLICKGRRLLEII